MIWENFVRLFRMKSEKSIKKDYFHATKWVVNSHFIFGILPIGRNDEGKIFFGWFNWKIFYSITMYCFFVSMYSIYVVKERLHEAFKSSNSFDDRIYNLMFLFFGKTVYLYAVAGWFSVNKVCTYYNLWIDFEDQYLKVYGHSIDMNCLERLSKQSVTLSFIASACLVFGQLFTLPTYNMKECACYVCPSTLFFLHIALIRVNCKSIEMVGDNLHKKLERTLVRRVVNKNMIISHTKIWIALSNLTQHIGESFWIFITIVLLGSFIDIVVAGYGYVTLALRYSKLNNYNTFVYIQQFGLIVAVVVSTLPVIYTCYMTYMVRQKIEESFTDTLLMASTKSNNFDITKDIFEFVEVIKNNPPIISLGGYINIDRRLLTKFFCIIITYLVIMIQFRVGFDQIDH